MSLRRSERAFRPIQEMYLTLQHSGIYFSISAKMQVDRLDLV